MTNTKKLIKEFKKLGSNYFIFDEIMDQIVACDDIKHVDDYLNVATSDYKNNNIDYKITFNGEDIFKISLNSTMGKYLQDF